MCLDCKARFLRRKVLTAAGGLRFLVVLEQTASLDHGDLLMFDDGRRTAVEAAAEPALPLTGDLARLAWHIGNRHMPAQVEPGRILIRRDRVIRDTLGILGAGIEELRAPFTPEGSAYGHGWIQSHDHGHGHDH